MDETCGGRASPSKWAIGAATAVLLSFVPGCESHCAIPAIGCASSTEVTFEPGFSAKGTYELVFEVDGEHITCRASVPRDPTNEGCETDRGSPWQFGRLGWVEPPSVLTALTIDLTMSTFELLVTRDGATVARTFVEPTNEPAPPADECDFTCPPARHATVRPD